MARHVRWAEGYISLGEEGEFRITDEALEKRRLQLDEARNLSYATARDAHYLSVMVGGTVSQIEDEMCRRTVLDIGCGQGRFGEAMARKAKAEMTFVDIDEEALAKISKKAGSIVVANAADLPFEDESFDRTISAFSAMLWSETPHDTLRSLNEAVRVTETGGSVFFLPVFSYLMPRKSIVARSEANPADSDHPLAHKVMALQDHLVFTALERLREEGGADISWKSFIGRGSATGLQSDTFSAIIDIKEPIDPQLLEENLAYADQFVES
ncbi:MAG TPA: class I SAM-dependent methyltransferase [Candidatus Saccharimonadales bacterium]|nr:class I SAM-dependent methyltransferase [Candidatus Saccharimonadales bacterium]